MTKTTTPQASLHSSSEGVCAAQGDVVYDIVRTVAAELGHLSLVNQIAIEAMTRRNRQFVAALETFAIGSALPIKQEHHFVVECMRLEQVNLTRKHEELKEAHARLQQNHKELQGKFKELKGSHA